MKRMSLSVFAFLLTFHSAYAADSVFSRDASHVYLRPYQDAPGLIEVDLQKKTCKTIDLKDAFHETINDLALSNAGFVLCSTKKDVWAFNPSKSKCIKVCDSPGVDIDEIAYDPKSESIFVTTSNGEYAIPKNSDTFRSIFNRRAAGVSNPTFAADGTLFFAIHGDLWMGCVKPEDKDSDVDRYATLVGVRCAPLAALETSEGNASSTGVHGIAVSKNSVYAQFSRMGGSGWGNFIRFKRPSSMDAEQATGETVPGSESYWSLAKSTLGSVETLADCSSVCYLCASPDGKQVFFMNRDCGNQSKVYLVQNDGKPELIEIAGLADALGWK